MSVHAQSCATTGTAPGAIAGAWPGAGTGLGMSGGGAVRGGGGGGGGGEDSKVVGLKNYCLHEAALD